MATAADVQLGLQRAAEVDAQVVHLDLFRRRLKVNAADLQRTFAGDRRLVVAAKVHLDRRGVLKPGASPRPPGVEFAHGRSSGVWVRLFPLPGLPPAALPPDL